MQIILFIQKSFLKMHRKQPEDTQSFTGKAHWNVGNRVYELGKSGLSLERLLKVTVMETNRSQDTGVQTSATTIQCL